MSTMRPSQGDDVAEGRIPVDGANWETGPWLFQPVRGGRRSRWVPNSAGQAQTAGTKAQV